MYIFDKYEYGYKAYKRGFSEDCAPQSKSLSNELKCIAYYLKKEGKSLEEINGYMVKQLEIIYSFVRRKDIYIKNRLDMVEREYNSDDMVIRFCQKEIDYLNKQKKNVARVIFYIMCVYKMYGKSNIDLVNENIRLAYNTCIHTDAIDSILYKLNEDGVISSKMLHLKDDVRFVTTISDEIINMYDGNYKYEFTNIGNMRLLFDYVTGLNKNVVLCSKCGVVVERTPNRKYCDSCSKEIELKRKR